ncbi:zinc finger MYND domain-containing protein 10 [Sitophilus oryzae]|uniref:Zinc finger MYND domain-containing protein 10 n=1 Tax=Sitophilus oryzae TaxID=7048 RepID=A0A6J2X285_SITOR|nr:zinc finger MYND domain-containing protein 10 [Sitophilus oryzae]
MESVLLPSEIDFFVEALHPQRMKNLGTEQWLEWHNRIQKLNQEALVEAASLKEEHVKEALISFGKVYVLIHEAILINIWKHKVLPKLLQLEPAPECTFIAYSILYHEGVCVSLLELFMYHSSACEALGDSAIDLLDYVTGTISQLLNVLPKDQPDHKETSEDELCRQRTNLSFEIGIRGLSILRYLVENMDRLSISVCSRIYTTHDIPVLLTEILIGKPWFCDGKQYINGKWMNWDGEQLCQAEAQVWLALRHVLLDPECPKYYPITENRRRQLVKLIPLMTPNILDQLSPLMELKHWLCRVSCMEEYATPAKPILLEPILEIKERILQDCGARWKKIAENQVSNVFSTNRDALQQAARKLSEAYNTDLIEKFEAKSTNACAHCRKSAIQRCSNCKKTWYCSRSCQMAQWQEHKENCFI